MNATAEKLTLKSVPAERFRAIGSCLRPGEGESVPDWRWQDRLWIMADGRPTLRKPVVRPYFDAPDTRCDGVFGDSVDTADIEQDDERDLLIEDVQRESADYLAKPEWCYLRWTGPGQVEALRMYAVAVEIDYPMVVACDLARQVDDGTRKKGRKGTVRRIATEAGTKLVFPWPLIKAVFTRLDIDLRKSPVVMSRHALDLVRK